MRELTNIEHREKHNSMSRQGIADGLIVDYSAYANLQADAAQGKLNKKSTYRAGGNLYNWNGISLQPVGGSLLNLTPGNILGSAQANSNAIQTAVNTYGNIAITSPGLYPINFGLILPSNTDIYLGAGVTLQQATGSTQNWFAANSEYNQTAVSTSGGIVSSWYGGSALAGGKAGSWNIGTITFSGSVPANIATAQYLQLSPGNTAASGIAGDVTGLYDGVFPVIPGSYNSGAGTIQFIIRIDSGSDVLAPSFVGSIMVVTANSNIRIHGSGTIDFNNGNTNGPGTLLQGDGFVFNRVANSVIKSITFNNVNQNIIQGANMYNCKFVDIHADQSNGGIQFSAHNRDIYISGWSGRFDDDPVAYMSSTGDSKSPVGLGSGGSLNGLTVENMHLDHLGSRLVLIVASSTLCDPSGIAVKNVVIRNNSSRHNNPYVSLVGGSGLGYEVGIINNFIWDNNYGKGLVYAPLEIDHITMQGDFTIANLPNCENNTGYQNSVIQLGSATNGNVTIPKLLIKDSNISLDSSVTTAGLIQASSGSINQVVGDITLENCNINTVGAGTYAAYLVQTGNGSGGSWGSLNIIGGSTSGHIQYSDNQNTIGEINISGNHRWGTTSANYFAPTTVYRFNGMVVTPAANTTGTFNLFGAGTFNLNLKDIKYGSTNGPFIYCGGNGSTFNINIDGLYGNPASYAVINGNAAAGVCTYNVYVHNVSGNTQPGFSNTSSYVATVNWNNPDGTLPVPFGGANITTVKTNKGAFATPNNGSAPSGYTGTYVANIPHVSDGTNFRSMVNPTANYF